MQLTDVSRLELTTIMKEPFAAILSERRDLLEDAVAEAILDMKLGLAIEEGDVEEYVSEEAVLEQI